MEVVIIIGVVIAIGVLLFILKGKKKDSKGGQGGVPEQKPSDPNYPANS